MDIADSDFVKELNELRRNNVFCDAVISIPEESGVCIPIHRVVLASCSQYFRSLFKYGTDESNKEIKISGVSSDTMRQIVEYGYIRKVNINKSNIENLFAAADRFHIFGLLKECTQYLLDEMCVENCIGILKFAKFYNCEILKTKAMKFVLSNLANILESSQEFVIMEPSELLEILLDDELLVKDESEVYEAIKRWVDFSYIARRNQYESLFQAVRLPFCKRNFITGVIEKNKTIRKSKVCKAAIEKAKQVLDLCDSTQTTIVSLNDSLLRPRVPSGVIFTVGGWSSEGVVNSTETYDKNVDNWFTIVPPMASKRSYHGTVTLNNLVFVIGGFDSLRYLNSVMCFDPERKAWFERGPMHLARCYVTACVVDDYIYACGGFDGRQRHSSVERYDISSNQWSLVKPMSQNRSDAGSACHDSKLYIVGGFDGITCLDSVECYNPSTDQWTQLEKMSVSRSGVALVTLGDSLVALGGYDGGSRLPSAEQFDLKRYTWRSFDSMEVGRSNFAAVVLDGNIYAIGGYDGSTTSNAVEVYDPLTKEWSRALGLNSGRSAVSACVVSNEGSLRDYTFYGANSLTGTEDSP